MFKAKVNPLLLLPFLVIFYFVLHECNANFGLIPSRVLFEQTASYVVIAILVMAVWYIILKKITQAVLLTFLIVCILLFFGSFHDFIKQLPIGNWPKRYIVVYPFLLAIVVAAFIWMRRSKRDWQRMGKYFLVTAIILLAWESIFFFINVFTARADKNVLFVYPQQEPVLQAPVIANDQKPDIYFIVFDAFTSSTCLREEFGYNNSGLDSFLQAKNFHIISGSKSNYPVTPFSIASTLNFSYLSNEVSHHQFTAQDMVKGAISIEHVRLIPYLQKQGYAVFNHSIFNLAGHPVGNQQNEFLYAVKRGLLTQQTFKERFRNDIGWNFTMRNWRTGAIETAKIFSTTRSTSLQTFVFDELNGLYKTLATQQTQPKFVYCHVLLPHEPYYFNSDGSFVGEDSFYHYRQPQQAYRNQLIYASKVLQSVVDTVFACDHKNKIVVVEGDHGFRDYGRKDNIGSIYKNLNAIYFYDNNYAALYNSMSPVNTFRVILNQYFHEKLPYLKDSSIFINDPGIDIGQYKR